MTPKKLRVFQSDYSFESASFLESSVNLFNRSISNSKIPIFWAIVSLLLFCSHKNIVKNKLKKTKKANSEKKIKLLGSSNPKVCAILKSKESKTAKNNAAVEMTSQLKAYLNVNFSRRTSSMTVHKIPPETMIASHFISMLLCSFLYGVIARSETTKQSFKQKKDCFAKTKHKRWLAM